MKYTFNSQLGEDLFVFKNFINKFVKDGIFIELGAMDGIIFSNSKFFEDYLGFNGILIEPTKNYEKLIVNRPKCLNYNYAISDDENDVLFIGNEATAGILNNLPKYMLDRYHQYNSSYLVKAKPINAIISDAKLNYVDIFFIDVEGAELIVLETIDWNIPIYIIIIELHGIDIEKDNKCRELLNSKSFKFYKTLCTNEVWINESYSRKDQLFDKNNKINQLNSLDEIGLFPYVEKGFISSILNTINSN